MDPILIAERIFTALTEQTHALATKQELAEDLRNLADWLDNDGFIPYVNAETGIAPR